MAHVTKADTSSHAINQRIDAAISFDLAKLWLEKVFNIRVFLLCAPLLLFLVLAVISPLELGLSRRSVFGLFIYISKMVINCEKAGALDRAASM